MVQQRRSRHETVAQKTEFLPAIVFDRPSPDRWGNQFFLTEFQESFDANGYLMRHSGPLTDDPNRNSVMRLITPVLGFEPLFRDVEILGFNDRQAVLIESDTDSTGLLLYSSVISNQGSGDAEVIVTVTVLPFTKLVDIVAGTNAAGTTQIKLPDTDIATMKLAVRASSTGEPVFAVDTVKVSFDRMTTAQTKRTCDHLRFDVSRTVAFVAAQLLEAQNAWPPAPGNALDELVGLSPNAKKVLASVLVGTAATLEVVALGLETADQGIGAAIVGGTGILLAGTSAILLIWAGDAQAPVLPVVADPLVPIPDPLDV